MSFRDTPVVVSAILEPGTVLVMDLDGRNTIVVSRDVYEQILNPIVVKPRLRRRIRKALPALMLWAANLALLGWILWQVLR